MMDGFKLFFFFYKIGIDFYSMAFLSFWAFITKITALDYIQETLGLIFRVFTHLFLSIER